MPDLDVHLGGIVAGDVGAFARWLAGAEPRVRASLRPLAARVDVEAVLQETLLRVWQVAPRFRPDGRPDGLLRLAVRIARNLALDELARSRQDPVGDAELERRLAAAGAASEAPAVPDPFLRRAVAECRERLPERPAAALAARLAADGERDEALAARLGMRLNTFLQNFGRARRLLAACLEARGIDLLRELA